MERRCQPRHDRPHDFAYSPRGAPGRYRGGRCLGDARHGAGGAGRPAPAPSAGRPRRGDYTAAMTYIRLDLFDLALPALFLVLNGALSVALNLGLERQLA